MSLPHMYVWHSIFSPLDIFVCLRFHKWATLAVNLLPERTAASARNVRINSLVSLYSHHFSSILMTSFTFLLITFCIVWQSYQLYTDMMCTLCNRSVVHKNGTSNVTSGVWCTESKTIMGGTGSTKRKEAAEQWRQGTRKGDGTRDRWIARCPQPSTGTISGRTTTRKVLASLSHYKLVLNEECCSDQIKGCNPFERRGSVFLKHVCQKARQTGVDAFKRNGKVSCTGEASRKLVFSWRINPR